MPEAAEVPRWWRFVADRSLHCSAHHSIPNNFRVTESGFVRCQHWIEAQRRECGSWLFVYVVRGGHAIVAEVTLAEQRAMERMSTPAEMMSYLRIFAPHV